MKLPPCQICLETLERDLQASPCGHLFHTACIGDWLHRGKKTCPICKRACTKAKLVKLFFEVEGEEEECSRSTIPQDPFAGFSSNVTGSALDGGEDVVIIDDDGTPQPPAPAPFRSPFELPAVKGKIADLMATIHTLKASITKLNSDHTAARSSLNAAIRTLQERVQKLTEDHLEAEEQARSATLCQYKLRMEMKTAMERAEQLEKSERALKEKLKQQASIAKYMETQDLDAVKTLATENPQALINAQQLIIKHDRMQAEKLRAEKANLKGKLAAAEEQLSRLQRQAASTTSFTAPPTKRRDLPTTSSSASVPLGPKLFKRSRAAVGTAGRKDDTAADEPAVGAVTADDVEIEMLMGLGGEQGDPLDRAQAGIKHSKFAERLKKSAPRARPYHSASLPTMMKPRATSSANPSKPMAPLAPVSFSTLNKDEGAFRPMFGAMKFNQRAASGGTTSKASSQGGGSNGLFTQKLWPH